MALSSARYPKELAQREPPSGRATLLLLALLCAPALAAPVAEAVAEGVSITLTNEPCRLKVVSNLPARATWTEKGKTFEGCFGLSHGVVAFYFDDRTVVMLPREAFKRARQI